MRWRREVSHPGSQFRTWESGGASQIFTVGNNLFLLFGVPLLTSFSCAGWACIDQILCAPPQPRNVCERYLMLHAPHHFARLPVCARRVPLSITAVQTNPGACLCRVLYWPWRRRSTSTSIRNRGDIKPSHAECSPIEARRVVRPTSPRSTHWTRMVVSLEGFDAPAIPTVEETRQSTTKQ